MSTGNVLAGGIIYAEDVEDELDAAALGELSTAVTVANTTTETALATYSIGAGIAVAGSVWRVNARGIGSVTGTPTMTWRVRLGGVAGTLIATSGAVTASSGITNHTWEVDLLMSCLTTGASGTAHGVATFREALSVAGASGPWTVINRQDGNGSVTFNTTISNDLVITGQWSAASSSNTITTRVLLRKQES